VLRVYHAGRSVGHRAREQALAALGANITLVVPEAWPGPENAGAIAEPHFELIELGVVRPGDVNRHRYRDPAVLAAVIAEVRPDVLDVHEEPFSLAAHQWLRAAPLDLPIVMYTAQNIDKRFPPPFSGYERAVLRRAVGLYPCSRQAASVARTKGFGGVVRVIPLGVDGTVFRPGTQSLDDQEIVLGLFGRLVPEKGVLAAVHVLARVKQVRAARLILVGDGPEGAAAMTLAGRLGIRDDVRVASWRSPEEAASLYRDVHVLLVPSVSTPSWAEQFGRVIVEGQASGAVVVGYASGAIPEVAGDAGVLVNEGDLSELSESVVTLIGNPGEWFRRRDVGLAQTQRRTWERVAADQLDLYRAVLVDPARIARPRLRSERERTANAEFGPSASTPAGLRPFAFPPLNKAGRVPTLLGAAVDGAGNVAGRLLVRM
jgi:glycosyltransferase involved in cell wall biosynthesis